MDKYDLDNFDYDRYKQRQQRSNSNRRRTHKKRTRNRIIIVTVFIVIVALFTVMVASCANCLCSSNSKKEEEKMAAEETSQETTVAPTTAPPADTVFIKPQIKDDGKSKGVNDGGLYVWNKQGFELFFGTDVMGERYAELMNTAGKTLGESVKTYSIIIPNHTEFGLPDRLKTGEDGASTQPQDVYIKAAYGAMDKTVIPVNAYNKLSEHCNDYIYFASDHHWTGLGAYYAYAAFAEKANLPVLQLSTCTEGKIEGFTGTLQGMVSSELNKDTVSYWKFPYEAPDTITTSDGQTLEVDSPYYEDADGYGVFIYGDNPLEVIKSKSTSATAGKVAVIHESYGNAFVPYLTYNFSEVYSIDFRSWSGSLKTFCQQNGITNVIFINGVMSSATQVQLDSIQSIL